MSPEHAEARFLDSKVVSKDDEKKKKMQLALLGVLVPVFLILVYTNIIAPMAKPKRPAAPTVIHDTNTVNPSAPTSSPSVSLADLEKSQEANEWGRSPFSLGPVRYEEEGALKLEGIIFDGRDSYAVIDRKIVRKDDQIAGNLVKEIRVNEVVLQSNEGEILVLKT